ncbi:9347_t:CDS:2, partial [Entrophospora sp. SA101]
KYEYLKIEKALATATDVIEQLKDKQDKLSEALDNSKSRHEKDMANNRRHVAALKREKSDLTKNLDELQTQLDNLLATKNLRKRGQDVATSVDGETDSSDPLNSGAAGVSPTSSSTLPGSNLGKDDVMKALDTANRMICGLRANLQKEKSEKYELKKLLADNQEQIEILQYESEFQGRANVNGSKNAQFNGKGGDDEYDDRSTSTSTISRKEFKSVEVQTEDKSAGISGTEFRSVEVQTEEVSSSLEDNNTSSIINNKEAPLQNSLNTPSTSKDFEQQAGLSKISKYIDGKNLEGLNDSVSTNSSRTSTDQIIRQIDSSNVDSGSGVGGGQIMDSNYNNETTTTDPDIIRLITRTMVGDDLWKYYKPNFGGGILEKRHKRFFWSNTKEKTDKSLERGEWMLVPPSSNFLGGSTTSMKSRKFKQKTTDPSSADNSLWTETPAERKERLQKEVITGQKRKRASDKDEDEEMKYTEIDLKRAELVKEYNEHHRPKSLLEQHQENYKKSKKWEKDDVSRRPFDREKDLMSRRPMDSRKRNELLGSATNL